jgi:hypothetical protein
MQEHIKIDVEKKKIKQKRKPIRQKKIFIPPSVVRGDDLIINRKKSVFDIKVVKHMLDTKTSHSVGSEENSINGYDTKIGFFKRDSFYKNYLQSKQNKKEDIPMIDSMVDQDKEFKKIQLKLNSIVSKKELN